MRTTDEINNFLLNEKNILEILKDESVFPKVEAYFSNS